MGSSTTLQRQLAALAAPASSLLVPERRRTSILFPSKEAAGYNRDFFYKLGIEGLNELIEFNPNLFFPFEDSILFQIESKDFERIVTEKETNQELNDEIDRFLIVLSPYVTQKAALKCLEWLVHRFHIEKFNIPAILKCIMPYFDTKVFGLIVQVLEIEKFKSIQNNEWIWISPYVKTGLPISRETLFQNVKPTFITWLFETLEEFRIIHSDYPNNIKTFVCFMTCCILGVLNAIGKQIPNQKQNERKTGRSKAVIHCLWNQLYKLEKNLKNDTGFSFQEIHSLVYMIASILALTLQTKTELTSSVDPKLIGKIVILILKFHPPPLWSQAYLLLNLLVEFAPQSIKLKKGKLASSLDHIVELSSTWDLCNIASRLIIDNISNETIKLSPKIIWGCVDGLKLTVSQRSDLLRNVYHRMRLSNRYNTKKWAKNFLDTFERRYPVEFDIASKSDENIGNDFAHFKKGQNLYLLTSHPDPSLRVIAVKKLINQFKKKYMQKKTSPSKKPKLKVVPDANPTAQALRPRFKDEDVTIVSTLLKQKFAFLSKIFSLNSLTDELIDVTKQFPNLKCTRLAIKLLCMICFKFDAMKEKIFHNLIMFMFPTKHSHMKLLRTIIKSKYGKTDLFFQPYATALKDENISSDTICSISFDHLVSVSGQIVTKDTYRPSNCYEAMISLLVFHKSLKGMLEIASKFNCETDSLFPISRDNFPEVLKIFRKKQKLSLDLILSFILNLELTDFEDLANVLKFTWKAAEFMGNRYICVSFLSKFVSKIFKTQDQQLSFWCMMIQKLAVATETQPSVQELYTIRALQFFSNFVHTNPDTLISYLTAAKLITPRMATRRTTANDGTTPLSSTTITGINIFEIILTYAVYNDSSRVREWGLKFIESVVQSSQYTDPLFCFFKQLLSYADEIQADKEQTALVVKKLLQDKQLVSIRDRFVNLIADQATEKFLVIGLLKLCHLSGSHIFAKFKPIASELLEKDPKSEVLLSILDCYDCLMDESLEIVSESLKHQGTCSKILSKFTRETFAMGSLEWKKKIFAIFIGSTLNCEIPEIKVAIQRCVRKWTIEAVIITDELNNCISMEKYQQGNNNQTIITVINSTEKRKSNIQKLAEVGTWVSRTEVILELIQSKKRLTNKTKLIIPLFKLLKTCITLEEQSPVEYLKQLILTTLTMCCDDDDMHKQAANNDWVHFNVETVIDCLRCSRNPQTHHHALILLNYAAKLYPEQVLHGVMSLFTFMGNSILRQDDTYSTQLIQQTVTTIIPTFVNTNTVKQFSRTRVSGGIYFAFSSAVQDIPVHRRLPVFTSLVETLNPEESMWQLCIIIIDKALARDKKRSNLNADMDLVIDIVWKFDPQIVLSTVEKVYNYFIALPIYERGMNEESFKMKRLKQSADSKAVVDLSRKENLRDIEVVIYFTLELLMKICSKFPELESTKLSYGKLLEKCLIYSKIICGHNERKIFRLIAQRNLDVVDRINSALEAHDLVEVMKLLLKGEDLNVAKKMLDMINYRLVHKFEWFEDPTILLQLVEPLVAFAKMEATTDEVVTVIQTGFITLKLISRHLASTHPEIFVPVLELCLKNASHVNHLLCASSLLCLGELFCLKALIIPHLQKISSTILTSLKISTKLNTITELEPVDGEMDSSTISQRQDTDLSVNVAHLLCVSTMNCETKLVEQLGNLVGAKLIQKSLLILLTCDGNFGKLGHEKTINRKKVYDAKLKVLLKIIGGKIPLRNSIYSIQKVFSKLVESSGTGSHVDSIQQLMELFKDALLNATKDDFNTLFPGLCDIFLETFMPYRETVENLEPGVISKVESSILECLINGVVLKLSEGKFRPFYHKIFDWAGDSIPRLITFYRFSAIAAERIKSLFVTFAGYIISKAPLSLEKDLELTRAILQYFYHLFSNDREGFITIDRFNALVKSLVNLFESKFIVHTEIPVQELIDTIIQLAVATNDLNRWQHLIELISLKTQHEDSIVRLAVVSTLEAIANELGKDFLPLLPPAIPFLMELLNDEDENVEKETKKMLLKLENILGEPIQPYFQS